MTTAASGAQVAVAVLVAIARVATAAASTATTRKAALPAVSTLSSVAASVVAVVALHQRPPRRRTLTGSILHSRRLPPEVGPTLLLSTPPTRTTLVEEDGRVLINQEQQPRGLSSKHMESMSV